MSSPPEPRRRKKDPDRERTSTKDKEKDKDREERKERKKRSSRKPSSTTSTTKEEDSRRERGLPVRERAVRTPSSSSNLTTTKSSRMAVVPELDRRGSLGLSNNGSRSSLSYPTFSKTHSKEDPYAKDSAGRRKSPFTPEPTDVGDDPEPKKTDAEVKVPQPTRAPPSPPLTATTGADLRKTASTNSMRRKNSTVIKEMESGRQSVDSGTRLTPDPRFSASRSSLRATDMDGTDLTSTTGSQPSTVRAKSPRNEPQATLGSPSSPRPPGTLRPSAASQVSSRQNSVVTQSTDSEATSVGTQRPAAPPTAIAASPTNSDISPASVMDSSPRTPTQHSALPSVVSSAKDQPPAVEIITDFGSRSQSVDSAYQERSPLTPPPPPPPPMMPMEAPRVDYLLQNGGLPKPVPRSLLAAIDSEPVTAYSHYMSPRMNGPQAHDPRALFGPLQKILDDYSQVMDRSGSLAVATGYRSVARRLLDRLEAVFARNISSEFCQCVMCLGMPLPNDEDAGVNWGEILELVSGRCDLPLWPPFDNSAAKGLGISDLEAPCQRIDVDVPSEYRAHYAHQSQKTKVAVQSWLSNQQDTAPEEADDETLTFAMLTRLEQERRPLFHALLSGMDHIPQKAPPITPESTPPTISKAALALQRLYRLFSPPRNQLVVMYLINNPDMHNILATLSAVTKQEWEILISGRFDGFLWSGAESFPHPNSPPPISRGPSRGPGGDMQNDYSRRFASPFSPGVFNTFSPAASPFPGSRPGSTRPPGPAPVQVDEETEIAVLAEVEREIYLGMEAMEDAFEVLHNHAENVRRRLRERGAALSMVAQTRRGPAVAGIEVRMDTPAGLRSSVDQDENLEDLRSEIGPDDSASNVSHNRRRRGHRSKARHTPAPVEEEDEGSSLAERIRRRY